MTTNGTRYDDLRALFFNCTLKRSPECSNTQGLIDVSAAIMQKQGIEVETIRAIDHDIATGVWPDMTEHGAAVDAGPGLYEKVLAADILVVAGPGPSYLDPGSGGPDNDFTNRNTTFMTWNLLHLARMLKDAGGIPAYGNQRSEWDAGCRFDFENPKYR
jgi:multimeric flavodoxin WrbA